MDISNNKVLETLQNIGNNDNQLQGDEVWDFVGALTADSDIVMTDGGQRIVAEALGGAMGWERGDGDSGEGLDTLSVGEIVDIFARLGSAPIMGAENDVDDDHDSQGSDSFAKLAGDTARARRDEE